MSRKLLLAAVLAANLALLVVIYLSVQVSSSLEVTPDVREPGAGTGPAQDQPGPYLVIEVEGEANGTVRIDLREKTAPGHTARLLALAESGELSGVVFHRVIEGFMAQTGDVQFGNIADLSTRRLGTGRSDEPNLKAEFSDLPFERGVVGMARSQSPDSANSQFFIMFAPAPHLDGQYTVVGEVTDGMDVVDAIKRGTGPNGAVVGAPDLMREVTVEN